MKPKPKATDAQVHYHREIARSPAAWMGLATQLRRSAEAVWAAQANADAPPGHKPLWLSYLMLSGLGIENLLKGILCYLEPDRWIKPDGFAWPSGGSRFRRTWTICGSGAKVRTFAKR